MQTGSTSPNSLATLVRGDPDHALAAATFAARFVVITAAAVGTAVLVGGITAATPASMASIFLQRGRPLPAAWRPRIIAGISLAVLLGGSAGLAVLLNGPDATVAAIVLAFAVALAARGSAIVAIARDPLLIIFIFMGGLPAAPSHALAAGVGGALATLIVVMVTGLFDRRRGSNAGAVIAAALDSMAEALGRGGGHAPAVDSMRLAVGTLPTPIGSARRALALAGLMANVERQQLLLSRLERDRPGDRPDLSEFAEVDRACASALRGQAPPPEEEGLERARLQLLALPDVVLEVVRETGQAEALPRIAAQLHLLDLQIATANAVGLTRQARGHPTPVRDQVARDAETPLAFRSRTRIAVWRVLALLSLRSAAMRDALRLAAATGLAVASIELLPVGRGYWVMMTAVVALRASGRTTLEFGRYQVIGTLAGFAVSAVVLALGASSTVQLVIAGVALFLYGFAGPAGAILLGPAALTTVFIMALGQLAGSGLVIGAERVIDVGIGIAIAVIVAMVIWPGARERLAARALAESFATGGRLIRATGAWLIHRQSDAQTAVAWRMALMAGARAEEALTAAATSPIEPGAEYERAVALHGIATRIRFQSGDALRVVRGQTAAATLLDAEVDRVAERFAGIAAALEENEFDRITPAGEGENPGELNAALEQRARALLSEGANEDARAQLVYAVRVWHWLRGVTDEASAAEGLVRDLKPVGSA